MEVQGEWRGLDYQPSYIIIQVKWKAKSTSIKTNEWFHIRAFWNGSLINQKRHILGLVNPC